MLREEKQKKERERERERQNSFFTRFAPKNNLPTIDT